jgi:deazaflavin-dependent oxidoreductase (nitroreductase family)
MRELTRPAPPSGLRRIALRLPIWLFRLRLGWILGQRFVLVNHIGRRTGLLRRVVLEVVEHDPATGSYIVAAGFGTRSDWYRNLRAAPDTTIQVGNRTQPVTAVPLSAEQGGELMARYGPRYPMAAPRLCRLMGFEVDGSVSDYREVGERISFLRLEPRIATRESTAG